MTDEQFKAWAKSFLERTDTYSSWRGAAVEAIEVIEAERKKNERLREALEQVKDNENSGVYCDLSCEKIAREALAETEDKT